MTQEIAEIPIPKVELPVEYALGWRDGARGTDFSINQPVYWSQFETNSESIKKDSGDTYQITLSAGKTYKLTGFVGIYENPVSGSCYRGFKWYNVTDSKWVGSEGGFQNPGGSSYFSLGSGPSVAYVAIDKDNIFELRCFYAGSGDVDAMTIGTNFEVQHLQNLKI